MEKRYVVDNNDKENIVNSNQQELMIKRFILEPQKYGGNEPEKVKKCRDINFCKSFFNKTIVDEDLVGVLLNKSILNEEEQELDLILMLLEHFNIINHFKSPYEKDS